MVDEIVEDFLPDDEPKVPVVNKIDRLKSLKDKAAKAKAVKSKAKPKAKPSKATPTSKEFKAKIVRKVRQSKASSAHASIVGVGKPEMCQDGCGKPCKPGRAFLPGHFPKLLAWLKKTVKGHRPEGASNAYYHRVTTPAEARKLLAQFHIAKAGQGQKAKAKAKANPTTAITQPKAQPAARRKRRTKAEMEAARAANPGVGVGYPAMPPYMSPSVRLAGLELPAEHSLSSFQNGPLTARGELNVLKNRLGLVLDGIDVAYGTPAHFYLNGWLAAILRM